MVAATTSAPVHSLLLMCSTAAWMHQVVQMAIPCTGHPCRTVSPAVQLRSAYCTLRYSTGATGTSQSFEAASSLLLCSAAAHATVTAAGCTKHSRTCADICLCAGRTCLQGVRVLYHRMKRLCTTMLATIHLVYCHVVQAAAHCKALHERCCSELGPAFCSWHIAILCSPHLCIAYATSGQHRMTAVEEPLICPIRLQF